MKFKLLSKREESIADKIADEAFTVHKVLGRGKRFNFLINFKVPLMKNGINRIILGSSPD
jgi:hypothetical protein